MALIRRRVRYWEVPLNWIIVFFGNLAGALCYVAFMGTFTTDLEDILTRSTLLGALQYPRTYQVLGGSSSLQDKSRMGRVRPPRDRMQLSGLYGGMARVVGTRGGVQNSRTPLPRYAVCLSWVRARHRVSFE